MRKFKTFGFLYTSPFEIQTMSKENNKTAEEYKSEYDFLQDWVLDDLSDLSLAKMLRAYFDKHKEQYANAKQVDLINHIKKEVAKLEENTNTTDFAFDVINLLKSIKPIDQEKDE